VICSGREERSNLWSFLSKTTSTSADALNAIVGSKGSLYVTATMSPIKKYFSIQNQNQNQNQKPKSKTKIKNQNQKPKSKTKIKNQIKTKITNQITNKIQFGGEGEGQQ
jgi:hypothetical protein